MGMGNYKDSKIEILAKKGNGNFAYLDNIHEAEKVLVTEFTQTLYSVASDVLFNIKLNDELLQEYRLIGYDNKKSILAENESQPEGGEIGSGAGNTVIFEIVPKKDSLRNTNKIIGDITLHFLLPGISDSQSIDFKIRENHTPFEKLDSSLQFATAVTMFGLKLRQSRYFPDTDWDVIKNIAVSSLSPHNYLQSQFIELLDKSKDIYSEKKKRWWKNKD